MKIDVSENELIEKIVTVKTGEEKDITGVVINYLEEKDCAIVECDDGRKFVGIGVNETE